MNKETKNVCVPRNLFNSMFEVHKKWEEFSNEFEDFILSSNGDFIEKMKKAQKEHTKGKTRDLKFLKQELI